MQQQTWSSLTSRSLIVLNFIIEKLFLHKVPFIECIAASSSVIKNSRWVTGLWCIHHNSGLEPRRKSQNCPLHFSIEAPDFLQCPRSILLQTYWSFWRRAHFQMFLFSVYISITESTKHFMINSSRKKWLMFYSNFVRNDEVGLDCTATAW